MATLADDAVMESNRVDLSLSGEPFFARGNRVVHAGWFEYYPYSRQKDLELPLLQKDDLVELVDKQLEAKETQPPARYGQGPLIELMEKHNLGTKATRHAIIQNLYDRGYVHGNPVEPTEMGIKLAEALQEFAPRIASPEMTAELEKDMDLISVRDLTKEEVVKISRDLLRQAYGSLEQNREQMAATIYEGITDDRILGLCPKCGKNKLRVIRSKATKKRFVGCEGYPECDQTYPLPQRGDLIGLDEICPQCGSPKVKILGGRRPWILCLDPYCPTKDEYRAKQAARAARGAEATAETTTRKRSTTKKTTTKTAAAKKPATKTAATKTAAKKPAVKKPATRAKATVTAAATETTATATAASETAATKAAATKTAAAKKPAVKKPAAKATATKTSTAKATAAKKPAAKKPAKATKATAPTTTPSDDEA